MFYYVEFLQLTVVHYINKRFAALVIGCYFYCIVLFTVRSHVIYNYNRVILRAVRTSPCGPHGVCLQNRYIGLPCGRTVIAGSVSVRDLNA